MPSIKAKLQMFDPITFPSDKVELPDITAFRLTKSSGLLVAKATIVKPTTNGFIPALIASDELPRINPSPPRDSSTMPESKKSIVDISIITRPYQKINKVTASK
ncbi:MAG: hypothetical protein Kow0098_02280 [Ignavibacteriaceae bacterium]